MQSIIQELTKLALDKKYDIELIYASVFKKIVGVSNTKPAINISSLSEIPECCENNELFYMNGVVYAKKNSYTLYQIEMDPIPFDLVLSSIKDKF